MTDNPWRLTSYPNSLNHAHWALTEHAVNYALQTWMHQNAPPTVLASTYNQPHDESLITSWFTRFTDDLYNTPFFVRWLRNGRTWQYRVVIRFTVIRWNHREDGVNIARFPSTHAPVITLSPFWAQRMSHARPSRNEFVGMLLDTVARIRDEINDSLYQRGSAIGEYGAILDRILGLDLQLLPAPVHYDVSRTTIPWDLNDPDIDPSSINPSITPPQMNSRPVVTNTTRYVGQRRKRYPLDLLQNRERLRCFYSPPRKGNQNMCAPMCFVLGDRVHDESARNYLRGHPKLWLREAERLVERAQSFLDPALTPMLALTEVRRRGVDVSNTSVMHAFELALNRGIMVYDMYLQPIYQARLRDETFIRCAVETPPDGSISIRVGHLRLIHDFKRFVQAGRAKCGKCKRLFWSNSAFHRHQRRDNCLQCKACKVVFTDCDAKRTHMCVSIAKRKYRPNLTFGQEISNSDLDVLDASATICDRALSPFDHEDSQDMEDQLVMHTRQMRRNPDTSINDYWIALDIESTQSNAAALVDPGVHTPNVRRHLPVSIGLRFMYNYEADLDAIKYLQEHHLDEVEHYGDFSTQYTIDVDLPTSCVIIWGQQCTLGMMRLLEAMQPYYSDEIRRHVEMRCCTRSDSEKATKLMYRNSDVALLAHNGSRYDAPILLHEIILLLGQHHIPEWAQPTGLIMRGTSYLSYRILTRNRPTCDEEEDRQRQLEKTDYVGYRFMDSFRFLAHSLDNLGKTFSCTVEKGRFPYVWLHDHHQLDKEYRLEVDDPVLDMEAFPEDGQDYSLQRPPNRFDFSDGSDTHPMTKFPCLSREEWLAYVEEHHGLFATRSEIRGYLIKDLVLLSEVWTCFRQKTIGRHEIDPNTCVSAPALALKAFMKHIPHRNLATTITRQLWRYIAPAKMGGHTEPMFRFATRDPELARRFHDDCVMYQIMPYDANSLYPSVMMNAWHPVGNPKLENEPTFLSYLTNEYFGRNKYKVPTLTVPDPDSEEAKITAMVFEPPDAIFGFLCVDITPPDDLIYAPLGERVASEDDHYMRLEFNCKPKKKAIYFSEELKVACHYYGYKVTKVHYLVRFLSSKELFSSFIKEVT